MARQPGHSTDASPSLVSHLLFAPTEPVTVGRSHLQSEPLVLLLLFCLLTHKQIPGDWPTVRQCLFTLKTRVHTSELRRMEPRARARARGKRKPGPGGAAGAWGGAPAGGGFMIKTATTRVRWEKAEPWRRSRAVSPV